MKKLAVAVMGAAWLMTAGASYGQQIPLPYPNFRGYQSPAPDYHQQHMKEMQRQRERHQDRVLQSTPYYDRAAQRNACLSIQGNDRAQRRCFNSLR